MSKTSKKPTVVPKGKGIMLSVDWDFFQTLSADADELRFDFGDSGIKQSSFLWAIRAAQMLAEGRDYRKELQLNGTQVKFWERLQLAKFGVLFALLEDGLTEALAASLFPNGHPIPVVIADDHGKAYDVAKRYGVTEVWNFDAHTDLYKTKPDEVHCGNWLGELVKEGVRAHCVMPDGWDYEKHLSEEELADWESRGVKFLTLDDINLLDLSGYTYRDKYGNIPVSVIFIARSGGWSPPWLDADFERLVNDLTHPESYSITKRYWNDAEVEESAKHQREAMEALDALNKQLRAEAEAGKRP